MFYFALCLANYLRNRVLLPAEVLVIHSENSQICSRLHTRGVAAAALIALKLLYRKQLYKQPNKPPFIAISFWFVIYVSYD